MKKIIVTGFYFILTLAVSAAGFLMPSALSTYQDRQTASTIEHPAAEPMQFTYSSSLLETLRLISSGCYFVNYPLNGSSRSGEEIYEIALDVIKQMKKHKISVFGSIPKNSLTHDTGLALAIALENDNYHAQTDTDDSDITTAVVWACSIFSEYGYEMNIKIDDKSGKAVSFSMYTYQTESAYYGYGKTSTDTLASRCASFMADYYELDAELETVSQTSTAISGIYDKSAVTTEFQYIIHLKDKVSKTQIDIPLTFQDSTLTVNVS